MEGEFLIGQLAVLQEQGTAQHGLGRPALPPGRLDLLTAQVLRHQSREFGMRVEPLRHRLEFASDLVPGKAIE